MVVLKKYPRNHLKVVKRVKATKVSTESSVDTNVTNTESLIKKKRGRPKKNIIGLARNDRHQLEMEEVDVSNVKTYKFLGYCPKMSIDVK